MKVDGVYQWVDLDAPATPEPQAAYVHGDTFKKPLKHPKTGEMVDSMTRWNQINKQHGLRVVGNDWKNSELKNDIKDKITDEVFGKAFEKAEAIISNPDTLRERKYKEIRDLEKYYGRQSDVIKHIVQIRELDK